MEELIYGVVRGIDLAAPEGAPDERRLLVFALDTRTHSAARIYGELAQLDQLDQAELPEDAVVTPYIYALAGPADAVAAAWQRVQATVGAAFEVAVARGHTDDLVEAAARRLVGLAVFSPERFADLALLELLGGPVPAYPMAAGVALAGGWEARGLFATEGPDDEAWMPLVEALLDAWLEVEAVPGRDRPWAAHDIEALVNDPCYGFGLVLEPRADVVATVAAFTRGLAERPEAWTRASLEAEYRALFARMLASGRFRRGPDVPPLVPLEQWLDQQLARIARLRGPSTPA
ncbi:MAG TPA: hypothetical protein VKZ60_09235 [Chloroflexota bacterium]|jgi:hypothetical protein|nr:hypothetical protein [Chloroflexota bacterium]